MDTSQPTCVTVILAGSANDFVPPKEWSEWPTRWELAFDLSNGGSVTQEDYSRFRAESLREVAQYLFDPVFRRRLLRYSLKTDGVLPAYEYDAEWSLLRRGSTGGVHRRGPEQRTKPWDYGADTTLLEVWRQPLKRFTSESRIWLRAGGRSEKDAIRNWFASAQLLRKMYRSGFDHAGHLSRLSEPII